MDLLATMRDKPSCSDLPLPVVTITLSCTPRMSIILKGGLAKSADRKKDMILKITCMHENASVPSRRELAMQFEPARAAKKMMMPFRPSIVFVKREYKEVISGLG